MKVLLICLSLFFIVDSVSADIYRWRDENGKVHISDKKPDNKSYVEQVSAQPINEIKSVSVPEKIPPQEVTVQEIAPPRVVMFSTAWCPYCERARDYFRKNKIQFTERDIEKSSTAKRAYDKINGRGVPVILVNDKRLQGFSQKRFKILYANELNSELRKS